MKSRYFLIFVMAACLNACGHELLETEIDDGCKLHTVKCNGLTKFVCVANDEINELCSEADDILTCQSENYTGKTRWKLAQEPCECFDGQISYRNVDDENGNELCHEVTCSFGKYHVNEKSVDNKSCLNVLGVLKPGGTCINNESSCFGDENEKIRICVNGLYKEIECEGCSQNKEKGDYSCIVKSCENENKPFCTDNLLKNCESTGEAGNASFQITITPCKDGCVPGNDEHDAFCNTAVGKCKDGDVSNVENRICRNGEWIDCSLGMIDRFECRECLDGSVICDGNSLKICDNGHWSVHQCADQCVSNSTEIDSGFEMCVESDLECEGDTVVCDNGMLKKCEKNHWTYFKCGKGCIDNGSASYCKDCDDSDEPKCINNTEIKTVDISENYKGILGINSELELKGNSIQLCNGGRWIDKQCKSGCYGGFNDDGNGSVTCIDAKGDSEEKICKTADSRYSSMCISSEKKHVTGIDEDDVTNYYATTYCQIGCYSNGDFVGCGECLDGKITCRDNKKLKCVNGHWEPTGENCESCSDAETVCKDDHLFICDEGILDGGTRCPFGCLNENVCRYCDENEYPKCDENNNNKLTCDGLQVNEEPCENGCLNGECRQCKTDGETRCEGEYSDVCRDGKWQTTFDSCQPCTKIDERCDNGILYTCTDGVITPDNCNGFGCNSDGCNECGDNGTIKCSNNGVVGQYKTCMEHSWSGENICDHEYSCKADESDCGVCQNNTQKCEDGMEFRCINGEWGENKPCGKNLKCLNSLRCEDCNKSVCADDWSVRLCDNGTWNETIKPCEYGCTDGICNQTAKCDYMCIRGTINKCSDNDYESLNVTQYCDDETNKTYICSDSGIKIIDCSPSGCDETHSNCKNEPCVTGNS